MIDINLLPLNVIELLTLTLLIFTFYFIAYMTAIVILYIYDIIYD